MLNRYLVVSASYPTLSDLSGVVGRKLQAMTGSFKTAISLILVLSIRILK